MYDDEVIRFPRLLSLLACLPFAFPAGLCPCEWAKLTAGVSAAEPADDCCPHESPADEPAECPHCDHGAAFDGTTTPLPTPSASIDLSIDIVPAISKLARITSTNHSTPRTSSIAPSRPLFVTHCALVL